MAAYRYRLGLRAHWRAFPYVLELLDRLHALHKKVRLKLEEVAEAAYESAASREQGRSGRTLGRDVPGAETRIFPSRETPE